MTRFRSVSLTDLIDGYSKPRSLVRDLLRQLIVGHVANDTVHSFTFPFCAVPYACQVSKYNDRSFMACLLNYGVADFMTNIVDFPFLGLPDLADRIQRFPLAQPLTKPSVVSPNPPNLSPVESRFLENSFSIQHS